MRPEFHFTAERGWINDPHGITVRDGRYHVFYQYVPDSTVWAPNCHWGHAAGPDLFSLSHRPVAIEPGEGDDGIWTGCLVTDEQGVARILYTATSAPDLGIGRIREARSADEDWGVWSKGEVVAQAPAGSDLIAFRDPFVRRDPDGWRMFVGAASASGTAMALAYRSQDLDVWSYEGVALERSSAERDPVWLGALWECPQVIEVDGVSVMVSSVWDADVLHYAGYAVGEYAAGRFAASGWGRLTCGPSYYAPSFFRDAQGRPCLLFWMRGVADLEQGWASAHSVPYVLGVQGGRLTAAPHPDLERYRGPAVADGAVPGLAADVVWSPRDGATLVVSSADAPVLRVQAGPEALEAWVDGQVWQVPFGGGPVRVILDAQTIEISSPAGMLALVEHPGGDSMHDTADDATVHPLTR